MWDSRNIWERYLYCSAEFLLIFKMNWTPCLCLAHLTWSNKLEHPVHLQEATRQGVMRIVNPGRGQWEEAGRWTHALCQAGLSAMKIFAHAEKWQKKAATFALGYVTWLLDSLMLGIMTALCPLFHVQSYSLHSPGTMLKMRADTVPLMLLPPQSSSFRKLHV